MVEDRAKVLYVNNDDIKSVGLHRFGVRIASRTASGWQSMGLKIIFLQG
jgi:hypothetical protein